MKKKIDFVTAAREVSGMVTSLEKAITLLKYAYMGQTGFDHCGIDDALISIMKTKSHIAYFKESEEAKNESK